MRIVARAAISAAKFQRNWAGLQDRFEAAFTAAANMAASMIEEVGRTDIAGAGNFGGAWIFGLHATIEGQKGSRRIVISHDIPYAGVFEEGGEIHGNPLLWLPFSGTDAEGIRARDYGGLFSRPGSGTPLLFAISDKCPRYFGVESVTIPKKFRISDDVASVMSNFRAYFDQAFRGV